ncbi:hypothetical protein WJX72_011538 [[Myrmecia] bisecta]|uniref:Fe2OG dioxygenase domain-containing protein n=1 Tax=[Myrmecia] bisecta TaxID=41462 RepID=A0AAW1P5Z3_9CHLO
MMPPLKLRALQTHETGWDPASVKVAINARLDARIVPSAASPDGARLDYAHIVVLDDFFGEDERVALLGFLTAPDWDHSRGPPADKWERATADGAGLPRSWGLKDSVLRQLAAGQPDAAMREMPPPRLRSSVQRHSNLGNLPTADLQPSSDGDRDHQHSSDEDEGDVVTSGTPNVDCNQFVGNAAIYGDCFQWHIDADPSAFPPSPWVDTFGDYCNGEPGKPLFVSLMVYLDEAWPRDWDAETLFLDSANDVGVIVRPKRFRAVLMDQDVLHRVSTPSQLAGGRPRYSLVWKLVFLPRAAGQTACIARPEWGPPTNIGSAAHMENVKRSLAKKRKAGTE